MIGRFGILEILVVVIIIIFLFGPRRVGAFARSIGRTFFQYKRTVNDIQRDLSINPDSGGDKKKDQ